MLFREYSIVINNDFSLKEVCFLCILCSVVNRYTGTFQVVLFIDKYEYPLNSFTTGIGIVQ
jgi:hypothetical protein